MNKLISYFLLSLFFPATFLYSQDPQVNKKTGRTDYILSTFLERSGDSIRITGKPEIIDCKYGKALLFNGSGDGIFIDKMPVEGLDEFTVEAIFCPRTGGNFEQRFLHMGGIRGDRVLMEIRSTATHWYLDAFVISGDQQKTLIDPSILHPLNQWYHAAFIVSRGKLETYINGNKELEGQLTINPIHGGRTSIGVRLNEVSWFRGAIYRIRISPGALKPSEFMNF